MGAEPYFLAEKEIGLRPHITTVLLRGKHTPLGN